MDNSDVQLVGGPCGQHGPYTFYKAFKFTKNGVKRIVTLSEFFFVKMWRDSDLLCIGELQLLWIDKNSEQMLASLRLYFLPENTPEGRVDHGEDEVLAISEKVVIRVEDLITWITAEAEWTWGRLAKCEEEVKKSPNSIDDDCVAPRKATGVSFTLTDSGLDFADVENERKNLDSYKDSKGPHVIILSYPKYCRYRAMMKRLDGVEDVYLKHKLVNALGGFYVIHPNARVLFCKDTFDYPELEGHELLCNHLSPKLKGRPRGKRKKRSVSPGSDSNESESSITANTNTRADNKNGLRCESGIAPRRSTRCHENNENKEFVRKLGAFMKANRTPIGRIPSLGYKELNLHEFFTKVQKLGGYDSVTGNRLWKTIFEDMSGHQNSTSAATVIRRHYERFLLSYERHLKGEEHKPLPVSERRRLKSKRGSNSLSDAESSSGESNPAPSTSKKSTTLTAPSENKDVRTEGKPSSLRSVRVKPERQKDRQLQSEKDNLQNNNNNIKCNSESWQSSVKSEEDAEVKPKIEKIIIKTESMTVKTELSTVITQSNPVKIEYATVKGDTDIDSTNKPLVNENVKISVKIETNLVKTESNTSSSAQDFVKIENLASSSVKIEPVKIETVPSSPTNSETVKLEVVKKETEEQPVSVKTEPASTTAVKTEPASTTADQVGVKVPVGEVMSPIEGKENIPLIKTSDSVAAKNLEVTEVPFKPKLSETPEETDALRNNFLQEVKRRKLDILKEGGLEVTPVRPTLMSSLMIDSRPSVIRQTAPGQPLRMEVMPPPTSTAPQKRSSQSKTSPKTPTKKLPACTSSFTFITNSTPPRVVQSKSIYSYSEKTVYGNPKDILSPTMKSLAPKFIDGEPRCNGGDPVDLSVTSPQKPVIEIMRLPQSSSTSPYNRDSVTKNLYKTSSPLMDGRRLGPNLEITLVSPSVKNTSAKPHSVMPPAPMHVPSGRTQPVKRGPADYYLPSKVSRSDENGRQKKSFQSKTNIDAFAKPEASNTMKVLPSSPASGKPFPSSNLPAFPPYLSQLYEQASKGLPPYLPLIDPNMYYTAAMQNLYSNSGMNSAPMLPVPTPEQFSFYAELMAQSRLAFPFQLPADASSANNLKKQ